MRDLNLKEDVNAIDGGSKEDRREKQREEKEGVMECNESDSKQEMEDGKGKKEREVDAVESKGGK